MGITYDEAALQALIEYLQWLYDGALDGMMPDIDSVYGSDLFEQLGISSIDLDALLQAGIDSGIIRDDLGCLLYTSSQNCLSTQHLKGGGE